jgi:hypothetical protein
MPRPARLPGGRASDIGAPAARCGPTADATVISVGGTMCVWSLGPRAIAKRRGGKGWALRGRGGVGGAPQGERRFHRTVSITSAAARKWHQPAMSEGKKASAHNLRRMGGDGRGRGRCDGRARGGGKSCLRALRALAGATSFRGGEAANSPRRPP